MPLLPVRRPSFVMTKPGGYTRDRAKRRRAHRQAVVSTKQRVPGTPPSTRPRGQRGPRRSGRTVRRHRTERHVGARGWAISRSCKGAAASRSHWSASRSSRSVRLPGAARSRRASSTAQARTYRSSRSASSSERATTRSVSLSSSSRARCRATQSHCRQAWRQNSRLRPVRAEGGSTRRHHRQRRSVSALPPGGRGFAGPPGRSPEAPTMDDRSCVMTKRYPAGRPRSAMDDRSEVAADQRSISWPSALHAASA